METIGALPSITAKILTIVDSVLSVFVTISEANIGDACGILGVNATLTPCGIGLVADLADLVYYLINFGSGFLPALGAF